MRSASVVTRAGAVLGEGAVWDDATAHLYWVDIEAGVIHRCAADGSDQRMWCVGQKIGCVALRRNHPGLIAGLERSVALITLDPFTVATCPGGELDEPGNRFNDGKCDAAGRFWIGSANPKGDSASARLYRYGPEPRLTATAVPFICCNGPAFSPDGRRIYFVDSYARTIFVADVDAAGAISERSVFARFEDIWGYPDGLTCDRDGNIWVAHWGGARVSKWSPAGTLLAEVPLPVSQPTSCTFGGTDLCTLFITSAAFGLKQSPQSLDGAVLCLRVEVGGLPAARYDG